jgi:hypothetical protein
VARPDQYNNFNGMPPKPDRQSPGSAQDWEGFVRRVVVWFGLGFAASRLIGGPLEWWSGVVGEYLRDAAQDTGGV